MPALPNSRNIFAASSAIVLRPFRDSDAEELGDLRNDLDLQIQLLAYPRPQTHALVVEWLKRRTSDPGGAFFVVADPTSNDALGFVQLTGIDNISRFAEVGICISPGSQGRGIGLQALQLLHRYAATILHLRKVILRVLAANEKALRVYRRAGYRKVGTYRNHHFYQGKFADVIIMEKML
jgi:RimJ/RimL family protein N-acetyltransferase